MRKLVALWGREFNKNYKKMERISTNETSSPKLIDAMNTANIVLLNEQFYKKIAEFESFDYSDITGEILSDIIKDSRILAEVFIEKSINPLSKATAFTTPKFPKSIFIYSKYLNHKKNTVTDIVITLIHEYVHLVDYERTDYEFGHGSNYRKDKQNSAPYIIEEIVRNLL